MFKLWNHGIRIIQVGRDVIPTSCSKQGLLQGQTRLLRALYNWILKTSKNGHATTSLDTFSVVWLYSGEKAFPYIQPKLLVSVYAHCISFSHHTTGKVWLHLFDKLLISTGRLLLGFPWTHLFSRPNKPSSLSPPRTNASTPWTFWWLSAELFPVYHYHPCIWGTQS